MTWWKVDVWCGDEFMWSLEFQHHDDALSLINLVTTWARGSYRATTEKVIR